MLSVGFRLLAFHLIFRLTEGVTDFAYKAAGVDIYPFKSYDPLIFSILFWHFLLLFTQIIALFLLASWIEKRFPLENTSNSLNAFSKIELFRAGLILLSVWYLFVGLEVCLTQTNSYLMASQEQLELLYQEMMKAKGTTLQHRIQQESLFNILVAVFKIVLASILMLTAKPLARYFYAGDDLH